MPDKKRILLVEDEADILKMTTFRMRKAGYEVIAATDGQKGFDLAKAERPDLIFLDLGLPVMSGRDVCRLLKSDENLRKMPVVILTASSDGVVGKMDEIGADDYLIKPYEPDALLAKVQKFLS